MLSNNTVCGSIKKQKKEKDPHFTVPLNSDRPLRALVRHHFCRQLLLTFIEIEMVLIAFIVCWIQSVFHEYCLIGQFHLW